MFFPGGGWRMLPIPPAKDASESAGLPVPVHCWDLRPRCLLGLGSGCRVLVGGRLVLAIFGSAFFLGRAFLIDRDLRIKTKETGFLLNLQATTKDFPKKPGF